jgi:hypothetical protein
MVVGVRDPIAVKGIPDRKEGEVPFTGRLFIDQEEKELVKDEANIMVYTDVKNEGA